MYFEDSLWAEQRPLTTWVKVRKRIKANLSMLQGQEDTDFEDSTHHKCLFKMEMTKDIGWQGQRSR